MFFDILTLIYSLKILPRESMTRYDRYTYNLYKGTTRVPRNNCRSLLEAPLLTIPFLEGSQHWHRWRSRRTCRRSCSSCRRSRRSRCWRRNPWVHNQVALSAHCWRAAAICTELCGCCLCPFESHSVGIGTQVPRGVSEWAAVRPNRAWSLPSSSKSSWTLLLRVFEKFSNVSFRDSCFLQVPFFVPSSLYVQVHLFQGHLFNQILREVSTNLVVSLFCFLCKIPDWKVLRWSLSSNCATFRSPTIFEPWARLTPTSSHGGYMIARQWDDLAKIKIQLLCSF